MTYMWNGKFGAITYCQQISVVVFCCYAKVAKSVGDMIYGHNCLGYQDKSLVIFRLLFILSS